MDFEDIAKKDVSVIVIIEFPNKKYEIIYADPPWEYENYSNSGKRVADPKFKITPYKGMSVEDIKTLPINQISNDDSILLLWVTYPCLQWGLDVVKAWGFEYKTVGFTWVKRNKSGIGYFLGLGNYTRANAEICLLATKGKGCHVIDRTIPQVCDTPLTKHSKKPNVVRTRIVKLFGDLPRIELFARTKVHGWDVWGNDQKLENQPLEAFIQ